MTNLFMLPVVNLSNWVIKQMDSIYFSPGTSAVLQIQIMLAEMIQVTRPLSHFGIRPLTLKQNKTNGIKVGGTGSQSGLFVSSKENPHSDAWFCSKTGFSSA